MLRPHLQIQLLTAAARRVGAAGGGRSQRGSIALLLLVALGITVGAVAIANSSSRSLLRSAFQSQSREAREAAIAGIDTIVSDLNRVENRRLLVTKADMNNWDTSLTNVCTPLAPPTAATTYRNGAVIPLAGNANRDFRLVSIEKIATKNRANSITSFGLVADGTTVTKGTYDPTDITIFNAVTNTSSENDVGYIRVTVQGRVLRAGNPISTATVTREFEVVPKCCNQSFGLPIVTASGVHGIDKRVCTKTSPGVPGIPPGTKPPDLGLLMGFNGGTFQSKGGSGDLITIDAAGNQVKLDNIICAEDEAAGQTAHCDTLLASKYNPIPTSLGNVPITTWNTQQAPPTYPGAQTKGVTITDSGKNAIQCIRSTSAAIPAITAYSNGDCSTGPVANFSTDYCTINNPAGTNSCLIDSISYTGNNNLIIQTADRPLRLFITGDTKFNGKGGLQHQRDLLPTDGTYASLSINECSTKGSQFVDGLQIYDTAAAPTQDLEFGTGTTGALGFFLFTPNSSVELKGNALICGKIWTKNLNYNGNVTFVTPPTNGSDSIGNDGIPDTPGFTFTPGQDFIARSTKFFRGF